jgi:IclR family pca regulon transcriptional regulator
VLQAFNADQPAMTLADMSRATGLTRATARRLLHTLVALGFVCTDGRTFELTPRVLDLGFAYVSSLQLPDIAQPFMEALSDRVHESVSASVLDGSQIVYVARVNTQRIMGISLAIGSRLPAAWTSMGRVLLAGLTDTQLDEFLDGLVITRLTMESITDIDALRSEIHRVRSQGYALIDQELEEGIRSVAAPLRDRRGRTLAAVNVGTHAARVTLKELRTVILPDLLSTARDIERQLAKR